MFEPPRDLLFNGNFEEAKGYAASQGKWLVSKQNKQTKVFKLLFFLLADTFRANYFPPSLFLKQNYPSFSPSTALFTLIFLLYRSLTFKVPPNLPPINSTEILGGIPASMLWSNRHSCYFKRTTSQKKGRNCVLFITRMKYQRRWC